MCWPGPWTGPATATTAGWSWSPRPATAIRLVGRVDQADRATGEVRQVYDSEREPDGVLLNACGTRGCS